MELELVLGSLGEHAVVIKFFFASRMVGNGGLFRNKSRTEFWVVLQFGKILFWIWIFIELYVLKVTM